MATNSNTITDHLFKVQDRMPSITVESHIYQWSDGAWISIQQLADDDYLIIAHRPIRDHAADGKTDPWLTCFHVKTLDGVDGAFNKARKFIGHR